MPAIPRLRLLRSVLSVTLLFAATLASGQDAKLPADLTRREWTIEGAAREALLYVPTPAKSTPAPVVFAFHGHGGTMRNAARTFSYHTQWPEAIVVYMQGLNTPGLLTDPEGKKPGWQNAVGKQDDRDLKFFDAVLASLKQDFKVDDRRIYSTGHSNGGGFTYLLWAARPDVFAAMAPSSAAAARLLKDLIPKPVLHVAGEKDPLVKFEWQKATMDELRKLNGCDVNGTAWEKWCTLYPSKTGTPVVTFIHPGDHAFAKEAPPVIVKFFKEHAKP
jgi:polyhydroxybutyrate depolymerase